MEELTDDQLIEKIIAEGTPQVITHEVIADDRTRVSKMKYTHLLGTVDYIIQYVNPKEHNSKYAQKKNDKILTKAIKK